MKNLTLRVDEQVLKRARKVALDHDTTVTEMLRDYLQQVAKEDEATTDELRRRLHQSVAEMAREMGPRTWRREDLYD